MVSEEGLHAYGAVTWGQFFVYQGWNDRVGWMHTSSGVDNIDEYLETVVKKADGLYYKYGAEERRVTSRTVSVPYKTDTGLARKEFTIYRTHRGPVVREADGKWVSVRLMEEPLQGPHSVLHADQGAELPGVPRSHGAAHQLVQQHDLRGRRRHHRVLPRQLHPEARREVRLAQARRRQRPRDGVEGRSLHRREPHRGQPRGTAGSTTPTTGRTPPPARTARSKALSRATWRKASRTRAASTPFASWGTGRTSPWIPSSPRPTTATCPPSRSWFHPSSRPTTRHPTKARSGRDWPAPSRPCATGTFAGRSRPCPPRSPSTGAKRCGDERSRTRTTRT